MNLNGISAERVKVSITWETQRPDVYKSAALRFTFLRRSKRIGGGGEKPRLSKMHEELRLDEERNCRRSKKNTQLCRNLKGPTSFYKIYVFPPG